MPKIAKRQKANLAMVPEGPQSIANAVKVLKGFKAPRFDQTIQVTMNLGIDTKQADQQIRGSVSLPKGTGKTARVVAFCGADKVDAAKQAGAIEGGGEELVEKINGGWMDFDVAVASPDMMRIVSKLGRVLGPKGLMPSPKAGTVAADIVTAVKEYSAGKVEYRNDDGGNVRCVLGKMSFPADHLVENFEHFLSVINRIKPSSSKGTYIKKCVISATMTPGIPIAV